MRQKAHVEIHASEPRYPDYVLGQDHRIGPYKYVIRLQAADPFCKPIGITFERLFDSLYSATSYFLPYLIGPSVLSNRWKDRRHDLSTRGRENLEGGEQQLIVSKDDNFYGGHLFKILRLNVETYPRDGSILPHVIERERMDICKARKNILTSLSMRRHHIFFNMPTTRSTGTRGALRLLRRQRPKTSPCSSVLAIRRVIGATLWSTNRSRTRISQR